MRVSPSVSHGRIHIDHARKRMNSPTLMHWSVLMVLLCSLAASLPPIAQAATPRQSRKGRQPSMVGRYRAENGSSFDFRADGSVLIDSSPGRYMIHGNKLILTDAKNGQQMKLTFKLTDKALILVHKDRSGRFVRVTESRPQTKTPRLVGRYVSTTGSTFEFKADGSALLDSSPGRYSIHGDKLTLTDAKTGHRMEVTYSLINNVLILTHQGHPVRFVRIPDIPFHCSTLAEAVSNEDFLCTEKLTRDRKGINAWHGKQAPALCMAIEKQNRDLVELLLSRGADPNIVCVPKTYIPACRQSGNSALSFLLDGTPFMGDLSALRYLIKNDKAPKYEGLRNFSGLAKLDPKRRAILKLLLSWGAHFNECDQVTTTAFIHFALERRKKEAERRTAEARKLAAIHRANRINDVVSIVMILLFLWWMVCVTFHLRLSGLAFVATVLAVITHLLLWRYLPKHDRYGHIVQFNNSPSIALIVGLVFFGMGIFFRAAVNFIIGHRIRFENPISMWRRFISLSLKRHVTSQRPSFVFSLDAILARLVFSFPSAMVAVITGRGVLSQLVGQPWSKIDINELFVFGIVPSVSAILSIVLIFQDYVDE